MQRTRVDRKKISQKAIDIQIQEDDDALKVTCEIKIDKDDYPAESEIILEAHTPTDIKRIELGKCKDYQPTQTAYDLPFNKKLRANTNFRLKIIDPKTYKIWGLAENLKETKYAKSLLSILTDDDSFENMYKIDSANKEHPIFYLNTRLKRYLNKLKPILAEIALKEILTGLLLSDSNDTSDLEDNKWFKFANNLVKYDADNKLWWIDKTLSEFSRKYKNIDKILKKLSDD